MLFPAARSGGLFFSRFCWRKKLGPSSTATTSSLAISAVANRPRPWILLSRTSVLGERYENGIMILRQINCRGACAKRLRSEEHTSELQSPCNLVCRLLLEKKKTRQSVDVYV